MKLYVVNNFKRIEIKIERDVERTIDLLNSNICHLSMGSPIEVALSSNLKKNVISAPLFNLVVTHVFTNQNNKFLTNYENRKLIKSILDKTKKMKGVLSRFDSELDTFFPKGIMNENYYQNKLTTNKIKTKNDKKTNTKLKIVFPYGIFSKIAENLIVSEFEKNGIIVNQKSVKGKDLLDPIIKGDYDLLFIPYQGMIADPDGFLNLVSPDSLFKSASIPIKDLFEKLSSARFEDNKKYRLDKYAKAIESFESSLYLMPYSQNSIPIVYNNCLKIPDMNFSFHLDLRGISFDKY